MAASQGWRPFFLGYANDYIAYVIPARYYGSQQRYEARASVYGPHLAAYLQRLTPEQQLAVEIRDLRADDNTRLSPAGT